MALTSDTFALRTFIEDKYNVLYVRFPEVCPAITVPKIPPQSLGQLSLLCALAISEHPCYNCTFADLPVHLSSNGFMGDAGCRQGSAEGEYWKTTDDIKTGLSKSH
jgi:hypothetical protein